MKRKVPEITESVQDLKNLLRQAKKKHEVQRLNVLYLLKSGRDQNPSRSREDPRCRSRECRKPLVNGLRDRGT